MSGSISLSALRDQAQDRADMVGQSLVTPAQWLYYINKSKDALYDLLISAYGSDYYAADPLTISLVSGTERYALPTDYYKTIKVEYVIDSNNFYVLHRYNLSNTSRSSSFYPRNRYYTDYRYREVGDYLYFTPIPSGNSSVKLWYVPLATNLSADIDTLKGFSGWEEYIIIDVAIKALRKEESDTSDHERDLMRITKRLEEMAESRNIGEPYKIVDVDRQCGNDFYNEY